MVTCHCSNELNPSPLYLLEKLDAADAVEATRRVAVVEPAQREVRQVQLGTEVGVKQSGRSGIRGPEAVIERSRLDRMERLLRPTARTSGRTRQMKAEHGVLSRHILSHHLKRQSQRRGQAQTLKCCGKWLRPTDRRFLPRIQQGSAS